MKDSLERAYCTQEVYCSDQWDFNREVTNYISMNEEELLPCPSFGIQQC